MMRCRRRLEVERGRCLCSFRPLPRAHAFSTRFNVVVRNLQTYRQHAAAMKRKRPSQETSTAAKRQKLSAAPSPSATWQLLQQYYPTVTTLRRFFASQRTLSKRRRRTILCLSQTASDTTNEDEGSLARLLDGVVVGTSKSPHSLNTEDLNSEISIFTQQVSETSINISPTQGAFKQSEVGFQPRFFLRQPYHLSRMLPDLTTSR